MRYSAFGKFFVAMVFSSALSEAQVVRTWVASTGSDANPCTRTAPCRNFAAAVTAVDPDGEVLVLDSGGYGPVTLDKSVALIAPPGIFAGIAPTSGNAVTISPFVSIARFIVRGLTLNSQGADYGITHSDGAATQSQNLVYIEDCSITGFGIGIRFTRTGRFFITRTILRDNGQGIYFLSLPSSSLVSVDEVKLLRNETGMTVGAGKAAVRNATATNNIFTGFSMGEFIGFEGAAPVLTIDGSQITHNGRGIQIRSGGSVRMFNSLIAFTTTNQGIDVFPGGNLLIGGNAIVDNPTGIDNRGVTSTKGDNTIERNTVDLAGAGLTAYTPK